ncbi:MAG: ArsR/SmtB family transcription factor [Chthonomonadales bacterium]
MSDCSQDAERVAAMFKALGDVTRLRIFELLCSCCSAVELDESGDARAVDGPTAGEVCCRITGSERISSTISFHLKELRLAGLITMERRGKHRVCRVNQRSVEALAAFFNRALGTAAFAPMSALNRGDKPSS